MRASYHNRKTRSINVMETCGAIPSTYLGIMESAKLRNAAVKASKAETLEISALSPAARSNILGRQRAFCHYCGDSARCSGSHFILPQGPVGICSQSHHSSPLCMQFEDLRPLAYPNFVSMLLVIRRIARSELKRI